MSESLWADRLRGWIAWNQEEVETSVRRVAQEVFRVRATPTAPSVAFHTRHIGRWVDRHTVCLSAFLDPEGSEPEVWIARDVATAWGLAGVNLGDFGGTGAGLDDDASAALAIPEVDEVLAYVTATFSTFNSVLARVEDRHLQQTLVDPYGDETEVAEMLLNHLSHADRHLGMIEALRGVLGERGTATQ